MERRAPSAAGTSTNSFSEHRALPKFQTYWLVAANVTVHEVLTRTSGTSCGCELIERPTIEPLSLIRRPNAMPLAHWRMYRERARQKRMALHMLALSGVVRPSHIELRYTTPILKAGTSNATPSVISAPITQHSAPFQEFSTVVHAQGRYLLQWLCQRLSLKKAPESLA